MKTNLKLFIGCIFNFVIVTNICAQTTDGLEERLTNNQERFIAINQSAAIDTQVVDKQFMANNTVFIQQIGTNNRIEAVVNSASSTINVHQNGEANQIDINETSKEIEKFISQTGSNNVVRDFSFTPEISTDLEIIQQGNDLYFERFGSNELSKNLKFTMTGTARTIIIRSF